MKVSEKQIKTIKNPGRKQAEALKILKLAKYQRKPKWTEGIFPKELENSKINNELNEIKTLEEKLDRNDLKHETNKHIYK